VGDQNRIQPDQNKKKPEEKKPDHQLQQNQKPGAGQQGDKPDQNRDKQGGQGGHQR
jgi:hypothetical protein